MRYRVLAFLCVFLISARAAGQPVVEEPRPMPTPHLRLLTGSGILQGPDQHLYLIPQGSHILDKDAWSKIDADLIRLQDQETRLTAENQSFRKSADEWRPGWMTIAAALGGGLLLGSYIGTKF